MLQRPWLTPFVVVFWCVTSGWLLAEKVLPSLLPGSPPGYQAVYSSGKGLIPVAWTVQWNDRTIGWALAETERTPLGGLLVCSRLHFDNMPLEDLVPPWARLMMKNVLPKEGGLTFDARGRVTIDAAGRLRSFSSTVNVPGSNDQVLLNGIVDAGTVKVHVQAGELRYETTRHLPDQLVIGDELSPHATMTGLSEGRRWTVPVYSPLRAANAPIAILHAAVGPEKTVYHDGHLVRVHVVTHHEDPTSHREPRSTIWVDRMGRVLKHEAAILGGRMTFVRRADEAAAQLANTVAAEGRAAVEQPPHMEVVP
jgi:hypothetical protein